MRAPLRVLRREDGQVIVLVALGLPLLLALLLLVVDGGRLFLERERLRNAAQLAAEAGVARVAEVPGLQNSQGRERAVREVVAEALRRNLGATPAFTLTAPFRSDIPQFNIKVRVERPFVASIQRISFTIAGEGAAKLEERPAAAGQTATPLTVRRGTTAQPVPLPTSTPRTSASTPTPAAERRLTVVGSVGVGSQPIRVAVDPQSGRTFVANYGSNSVSVIDTASGRVLGTAAVGARPVAVTVDPRTRRVFVANLSSNTVSVIDGNTHRVVATLGTGEAPTDIAVDARANRIYVANAGSEFVSVFDALTLRPIGTIGVGFGQHQGVAVDARANRVYVTNYNANSVSVIDGSSGRIVATVRVGSGPSEVAVDPSAGRVYVANSGDNAVSVIDARTNAVTATVDVGRRQAGLAGVHLAVDAARERVYVSNSNARSVWVLDARTNRIAASLTLQSVPTGIDFDPASGRLFVAGFATNALTVLAQ